jgi:hypothetical protein
LPFDCDPQCTCTVTFRSPNLNQFLRDTVSVLPLQLHPLKGASHSDTPTAETTLEPCPERTQATQIRVPPGMPPSGNHSEGGSHPPYPAWQPAECAGWRTKFFLSRPGWGGMCVHQARHSSQSRLRGHLPLKGIARAPLWDLCYPYVGQPGGSRPPADAQSASMVPTIEN